MAVQLYAKTQAGQTVQLDIYEQDPIKITMAVEEVMNVQQTAGTFSRTFRLPHTFKNQQFFQGVFNVNSVTFDATAKATAWINADGYYFGSGNIRLTNIYLNGRQNQVEYELLFMGETNDFSAAVGDGFLCELDFSEYTHDQTYANIRNSWDAGTGLTGGTGLFNGDVLYPLIEWGYSYNSAGVVQNATLTTGYGNSFTQNTDPLEQSQLKPALRIDAVWRKIFKDAGYGFTGAFFDSNRWKALYLISENEARVYAVPDNTGSADVYSLNNPANAYEYIYYNDSPTIFQDPGNNFNINTGYYVAAGTGSYTFDVSIDWETFTGNPLGGDIRVDLFNTATGATIDFDSYPVGSGNDGGLTTLTFGPNTLNTNTSVGIRLQLFNVGSFFGFVDAPYINITCSAAPTLVNPTKVMPCNFKKMDFLKSVIDRFRLVFVPNKNGENTFEIAPWDTWVAQGNNLDWSQKLDHSKDFKVSPLFLTQKRELVYNDQEDSDYPNFSFTQDNKKPYGQYKLDSGIELIKDTQEIKGIFAPVPLVSIAAASPGTASSQFILPSLAKDNAPTDSAGKREPIIPKPRIVFYNGERSAPITWYLKNDAGSAQPQAYYPLVSNFEMFPPNPQTLDLHWQNEPYLFDTITAGITGRTSNTVWNTYWQDWYDTYYSPYGRIAEGYFFIHDEDVTNLKFNDNIYANGAWWNPTRVMDYEVGGGGLTKVQLIKIGNVDVSPGATSATGTTGGTGGNPCIGFCQQWAVCNNNNYQITYSYTDCFDSGPRNGNIPPQVCMLICSCAAPTSTFTGFQPFLQGTCPNGPTGPAGPTGCTGCYKWTTSNNTPTPISFQYVTCSGATVGRSLPAYTSAAPYCSCAGSTGGGTPQQLGSCTEGSPNPSSVYSSFMTARIDDLYSAELQMGMSKDGVTFEPVSDGLLIIPTSSSGEFMSTELANENDYANITYTLQTNASTPMNTFLQIFVGEELLISRDVSFQPIGEPVSIQTPTPVNSVGYIFKLLNIPE